MATIHPFPCTPTHREINNDSDNNYYYIRARAREEVPPELQEIAELYRDILDRPMPKYYQRQALDYMASGIQADMICAVLAYTGGAPRPSWAYACAVIERQAAQGARTAADFHGNVNKWRSTRATPAPSASCSPAQPKRVIEQCYGQREYTDDEWRECEEEPLREMMAYWAKQKEANP